MDVIRGDSAHFDIRYKGINPHFQRTSTFQDILHKNKIQQINIGLISAAESDEKKDNPLDKIITLIMDDLDQKPGKRKKAAPGKPLKEAFKEEWDLLAVEKNIGLINSIISDSNLLCDKNKTPELKIKINSFLNKFVVENSEVMKTFYMSSEKDREVYFKKLSVPEKKKLQIETIKIWSILTPQEQANYLDILKGEEKNKFQDALSESQKKALQAPLIQGLGNAAQAAIPIPGSVQKEVDIAVAAAATSNKKHSPGN